MVLEQGFSVTDFTSSERLETNLTYVTGAPDELSRQELSFAEWNTLTLRMLSDVDIVERVPQSSRGFETDEFYSSD